MAPRVVITGIGTVTAFGLGIDPLWDSMLAGRTGIRRIQRFDPCGFPCKVAGELPDGAFDIRKIVPKSYRKATKVMCRDIELAVAAAAVAVEDADLVTRATNAEAEPTIAPHRFGCHIGAGLIAADLDELTAALVTSRGDDGAVDL
ncbi:MAG: beta-ketoacyl synthase N-terminal-like domain-containing protein, partial [Planctomycetota bacterium]